MDVQSSENGPVVGVRTTKIYCRPVCRAGRAPRVENCVPFLSGGQARLAGYRACKQCRPDGPALPGDSAQGTAETIRFGVGRTTVGFVCVAKTGTGLCALFLLDSEDTGSAVRRLRADHPTATIVPDPTTARELIPQVSAFLDGAPVGEALPLDLRGTPFQLRVWEALRAIPRGATTTYGALARGLGLSAGAARAVGTACGANPVSLFVPCHRVVRAGGQGLGGYYWGLDKKRALLALEGVRPEEVEPRGSVRARA